MLQMFTKFFFSGVVELSCLPGLFELWKLFFAQPHVTLLCRSSEHIIWVMPFFLTLCSVIPATSASPNLCLLSSVTQYFTTYVSPTYSLILMESISTQKIRATKTLLHLFPLFQDHTFVLPIVQVPERGFFFFIYLSSFSLFLKY